MQTYGVNNRHKYELKDSEGSLKFTPFMNNISMKPSKLMIDYSIEENIITKKQLAELNFSHDLNNFIGQFNAVIIEDWKGLKKEVNEKKELSSAEMRRFIKMSQLDDWQKSLLKKVKIREETIRIYFFYESDIENVWVIVNNPSTKVISNYSAIYVEILEEYLDIYFEFLVFGENEIDDHSFPKNTVIIDCEE